MKPRPLITALLGGVVVVAAVGGGVWYTTSVSPTICWGKDVDFDSPDADDVKRGWTHLHIASMLNACESAARLISHGADVNVRDKERRTPLHHVAVGNSVETAKLLIAHGADVNARDKESSTPLHYAASSATYSNDFDIETAKLLIAHGADVDAHDKNSKTPLHRAVRGIDIEFAEYNKALLHLVVHENAIAFAELLIANGADVNAGYGTTYTPLWSAIRKAERTEEWIERVKYPSKEEERAFEKLKKKYEKMIHLLRAHGGKCQFGC